MDVTWRLPDEGKPVRYVLIAGTLASGFDIVGPFDDAEAAREYADRVFETAEVVRLHDPDDYEEES